MDKAIYRYNLVHSSDEFQLQLNVFFFKITGNVAVIMDLPA